MKTRIAWILVFCMQRDHSTLLAFVRVPELIHWCNFHLLADVLAQIQRPSTMVDLEFDSRKALQIAEVNWFDRNRAGNWTRTPLRFALCTIPRL